MKKTFSLFCLFCLLCGALSSCSAGQSNPGSDLWGKWAFESQQDGNSAYFSDLEFQPDGTLLLTQTGDSAVDYVVIAPGRIKITRQGQSEVLNYDLSTDTLTLRFDKGHNVYTRSAPAVPVASLPTQPPISAPTQLKPVENIIEKLFSDKQIISPENAAQVAQLERWGKGTIDEIAWSPDGRVLAVASSIGIYFYNSVDLVQLSFIDTHAWVSSLAFSPDGKTLASRSGDTTIRLWDPASGALLRTLEGHTHYVSSLAFSPDGKTLASGSYDRTIRLWGIP